MKQLFVSTWQKQLPSIGTVHFSHHPKAKRISIKVTPTGELRVTVPPRVSKKAAFRFAVESSDWIAHARAKAFHRIETHAGLPLNWRQFDDTAAVSNFLLDRLEQLADQYGFHFNRVTIRRQKTIWGSCSVKNNISLNIHLARLPDPLIDYVMLHELTHTRHKNHGNAFWTELRVIFPQLNIFRQQLKQYHPQLFDLNISDIAETRS